jgi:hypothetical protein
MTLLTLIKPWTLIELQDPPWKRILKRYRDIRRLLPHKDHLRREILEILETEEWDELRKLILEDE